MFLQAALALQAGYLTPLPLGGPRNPCSCWGGSLSNPTVDSNYTPRGCWSGSLSNSTADFGDLETPAVPLSQHVPPPWACTARSCSVHRRLITSSTSIVRSITVGSVCFSPTDVVKLSLLSGFQPQGRWPAPCLPSRPGVSCPSRPASGSVGYRPPPSLLSDLRDAISAQIPFRPSWMAGQQYHPPMDYACVSTPPPAQSNRRYYTLFEAAPGPPPTLCSA